MRVRCFNSTFIGCCACDTAVVLLFKGNDHAFALIVPGEEIGYKIVVCAARFNVLYRVGVVIERAVFFVDVAAIYNLLFNKLAYRLHNSVTLQAELPCDIGKAVPTIHRLAAAFA